MNDQLKKEIDILFDDYESRKKVQRKEAHVQKQKQDQFLKEFYLIREGVIKPTMEQVGEIIKARNQNFVIEENDEASDERGKTNDAKISIYFKVPTEGYNYDLARYPSVSFIATKYKEKVWVHESTMGPTSGGYSGSSGEYSVKQITPELVQQKIMKVLKEIFGK